MQHSALHAAYTRPVPAVTGDPEVKFPCQRPGWITGLRGHNAYHGILNRRLHIASSFLPASSTYTRAAHAMIECLKLHMPLIHLYSAVEGPNDQTADGNLV
jgi:hypothetical protein